MSSWKWIWIVGLIPYTYVAARMGPPGNREKEPMNKIERPVTASQQPSGAVRRPPQSPGPADPAEHIRQSSDPTARTRQPADYVNPFIGASTSVAAAGVSHGLGKTFPGAATPFGLVQVSPNTITGGDNGSGYSYEHTSIEGFAFTH